MGGRGGCRGHRLSPSSGDRGEAKRLVPPGTGCADFHLDFVGRERDGGVEDAEEREFELTGCTGWALPAMLCKSGLSPGGCSRSLAGAGVRGLHRQAHSVPVAIISTQKFITRSRKLPSVVAVRLRCVFQKAAFEAW